VTEEERMRGAWEVYLYARDLLAKRMSYGMIAQSMLLIAFATLASGRGPDDVFTAYFQVVFATLGLVYTIYQYFRVLSIQDSIHRIEEKYFVGRDLVFSEYLAVTRAQTVPRNVSQRAIVIVFFCAWTLFLLGALFLEPMK
jgi:hypothetical protein